MSKRQNTSNRYAIYLRCSSDEQADREYSTIDAQREIIEKHIHDQGGKIVKRYQDEGKTGTNLRRPGWQALYHDAQAGLFDVVVITYMSRLGRGDTYTVAEYLLKQAKCRVETVKERFGDDLNGYMGKQMTRMMDGMFCKQISQYTRTKMEQMVYNGYFCGGQPPFGYMKVAVDAVTRAGKDAPKRLVPHPEEAEVVQRAFSLFLESYCVADVRNYLKLTTERRWDTTKTKYLLTNEVYLGHNIFGEWRQNDAFEAIIDQETWNVVQTALPKRRQGRTPRGDDGFAYYLRGLVQCPHCECAFTQYSVTSNGKRIHYYACGYDMRRVSQCPVKRINAVALHHSVVEAIERAAKHQTVMHRLIAQSGGWQTPNEELKMLRGQLMKQKQFNELQINNFTKAIGEGKALRTLLDSLEKAEQKQNEIFQQLEVVEEQIAKATVKRPTAEQVQADWMQMLELWDDVTEEERAELLAGLVRKVEVKQKNLVYLELSPITEVRGSMLALKRDLGAGVRLELTTFGL